MFKGQLFVFLILTIHVSLCVIDDVYKIGKEIWKLYTMIDNIELETFHDVRKVDEPFSNDNVTFSDIKFQIGKIYEKLDGMEGSMNRNILQEVINTLPSHILMFKCMDTFEIFIKSIDQIHREFSHYVRKSRHHHDNAIQNSTRKTILNIETNIAVIRKLMTDGCEFLPGHQNLVSAIIGYITVHHTNMCNGPDFISNILVHLFKIVIIAEMKVDVILAFINVHVYLRSEGWRDWNQLARRRFERQFGTYVNILAQNIKMADVTFLRACDPMNGTWVRDVSFYELEGTIQTTIFRYHWARCKYDSCNNVWFNKASFCEQSDYDSRSRCGNTVDQCAYLSAIHACVLENGPHKFLYVNSSAIGFLGKDMKCKKNGGHIIADGTGWDFTYAACACNCFSDRNEISLSVIESNVNSNRVIIGLRFFRKDRILYIQPREGKLDVDGRISQYSQRWVPIDRNIARAETHPINRENKVFFLDDLRLPSSFVLTGVKFNRVTRGTVTGFAIQIFGVPFLYKTGELLLGPDAYISRQASNGNPGKELSFEAVSSADTRFRQELSLQEKKIYVSLKRSTLRSDFGQSTLPLFDAVAIEANPPTALGGIGIFHKGFKGYAGFISLRVYGIQYSKYVRDFQSSHMRNNEIAFNDSSHKQV